MLRHFSRAELALRGQLCVWLSVCQSVCVGDTRQYCIKRAKRRITQITPRDSLGILAFWRQNSFVDDPLYPWNLPSNWPTPFLTVQFRPMFAHGGLTVRDGAKSSISANEKSTTRFPMNHRWTVYVTPKSPKGWLKTKIFTFGVALRFFVASNRRHFKLNMWVEHSKSHLTDDKMSLKWALPRHVSHFRLLVPLRYLWNDLS